MAGVFALFQALLFIGIVAAENPQFTVTGVTTIENGFTLNFVNSGLNNPTYPITFTATVPALAFTTTDSSDVAECFFGSPSQTNLLASSLTATAVDNTIHIQLQKDADITGTLMCTFKTWHQRALSLSLNAVDFKQATTSLLTGTPGPLSFGPFGYYHALSTRVSSSMFAGAENALAITVKTMGDYIDNYHGPEQTEDVELTLPEFIAPADIKSCSIVPFATAPGAMSSGNWFVTSSSEAVSSTFTIGANSVSFRLSPGAFTSLKQFSLICLLSKVPATAQQGPILLALGVGGQYLMMSELGQTPGVVFDPIWQQQSGGLVPFWSSLSQPYTPTEEQRAELDSIIIGSLPHLRTKYAFSSDGQGLMVTVALPAYFAGPLHDALFDDYQNAPGKQLQARLDFFVQMNGLSTTFDVSDSATKEPRGAWKCQTAPFTFSDCVAPDNCGRDFNGPFVCVAGGSISPGDDACMFDLESKPTGDFSGCSALDLKLAVTLTHSSSTGQCTVAYTPDARMAQAMPDIRVRLTPSMPNTVDWTGITEVDCPDCVYDGEGNTLTFTLFSVSADGQRAVPCALVDRYFADAKITASATLATDSTEDVLPPDSTAHVVALAAHNSVDASCSLYANFAKEAPESTTVRLIFGAVCPGPVAQLASGYAAVQVTLPPGWSLGASCTPYELELASKGTTWLPSVAGAPVPVVAGRITMAGKVLTTISSLYFLCENVTPALTSGGGVEMLLLTANDHKGVRIPSKALTYSDELAAGPSVDVYYRFYTDTTPETAALTSFFSGYEVKTTVGNKDLTIQVKLAGLNRAWKGVFTRSDTMDLFRSTLSANGFSVEAFSVGTGDLGRIVCSPDKSTFVACELQPPVGCSNLHKSPAYCLVGLTLGEVSGRACAFETMLSDYSQCAPKIASFQVTVTDSLLTVEMSAEDAAQFAAKPTIELRITPSSSDVLRLQAGAQCTGFTCMLDSEDNETIIVVIPSVAGDKTIALPIRFPHVTTSDSISLTAMVAGADVVKAGATVQFPLGTRNMYDFTAPLTVAFAPDANHDRAGALVISAFGASRLLPSDKGIPAFETVRVTLPTGWALGASCKFTFIATTSDMSDAWFPSALLFNAQSDPATGAVTVQSRRSLADAVGFKLVCLGVTASIGLTTDGPINIVFGTTDNQFVATYPTAGKVTFDSNNAPLTKRFIKFNVQGPFEALSAEQLLEAGAQLRGSDYLGIFTVKVVADVDDFYNFYFAYTGGARALESILLSPASIAAAFARVTVQGKWTLPASPVPSAVTAGSYMCNSGLEPVACVIAPDAQCGDSFQSAPACYLSGNLVPGQCVFETLPVPTAVTSGCVPAIGALSVVYSAEVLTLSFTKAAKTFLANPSVTIVLESSREGLFDWTGASLCTGSGAICSRNADGSLTLLISAVAATPATVTVAISSRVVKFGFAADTINVLSFQADGTNMLAAGSVPTSFPIGVDSSIVDTGAAAVITASFQSLAAPWLEGTLAITAEMPLGKSVVPDSLNPAFILVKLPVGWVMGSSCSVFFVGKFAEGGTWFSVKPHAAATSVVTKDGETVIQVPDASVASDFRSVSLKCAVTSPAAATEDAPLYFGFANAPLSVLARPATLPKLSHVPETSSAAPHVVTFTINTPHALYLMDLDSIKSVYTGVTKDGSLEVLASQVDAVVSVAIRFSGDSLVFLPLVMSTDLLKQTLGMAINAQVELDEGTIAETVEGAWKCKDTNGLPLTCALTPAGCANSFQSVPSCYVEAVENSKACLFVTPLIPGSVTTSCAPTVSSFTAVHDYDDKSLTVSYVATDASQFLAEPTLEFGLTQGNHAPFLWNDKLPACSSEITCIHDVSTGGIKVTVAKITGSGSFVVPAEAVRWDDAPTITLTVKIAGTSTNIFTGTPTRALGPIMFETVTADAYHSVALGMPSTVVIALGDLTNFGPIASSRFGGKSSITVSAVGAVVLSSACTVRTTTLGGSAWPLGAPAHAATTTLDMLTGAWTDGPGAISALYIQCDGVTAATADALTGLSVTFRGAYDSYAVEVTGTIRSSTAVSDAVGRYIDFDMTLSPDTATLPTVGDVTSAAIKSASNVELAPFVQNDNVVSGLLGFSYGSRAWFSLIQKAPQLVSSLVDDLISQPSASLSLVDVSGNPAFMSQGEWQCSTDGTTDFKACAAPNNCGALNGTPVCRRDGATVDATACAFTLKPMGPVTSGCGAWKCKYLDSFVDCADANICEGGCQEDVTVSVNTAAMEHLSPTYKQGRYQQSCVIGDNAVDNAVFCPTGLVTLSPYAPKCNAKTSCALQCAGADGKAKLCGSDLSWGTCGSSCGAGVQERLTYCAGEPLAIGATIAGSAAVGKFMCPTSAEFLLTRSCFGAQCTQYAWKCTGASGIVDCTDSLFSKCSASCGAGVQTREVKCVATTDGTTHSSNVPDAMCAARSPKPAVSRPCTAAVCSTAAWKCYPVGGNPFTVSDCASDETFKCAASGCRAVVSARRNVACYDGSVRAAASKCDPVSKPAATVDCAAVHDGCHVDFTGATCSIMPAGAVTTKCVATAGANSGVFRRGVCRNDKGEAVANACSTAVTDEQCTFPVCAATITYSWSTDSSAACVPGCRSYKPTPSVCLAQAAGSEPMTVDDSFCASAGARPAAFANCASEAVACANGGVCTAEPVVLSAVALANIWGKCGCPAGFSGASCAQDSKLSSVTVTADSNSVEWKFAASNTESSPFVLVSIRSDTPVVTMKAPSDSVATAAFSPLSDPVTDGESRLIAIVPSDSGYDAPSQTSQTNIDFASFAPGYYSLKLSTAGGVEFDKPFTKSPLCQAEGCENGGTCNTETGVCDCVGDFSGQTCEVGPCETLACNALTSNCDLTSPSTGVCVCATGFSGASCDVVTDGCPLDVSEGACVNGARRVFLVDTTPSCGECVCADGFSGALCDICTLSCQNGGTSASGSCGVCSCPAGFHGDACELSHTTMTFNFLPAVADVATEIKIAVWTHALQLSLNALVGDSAVPVVVYSVADAKDGRTGTVYKQVKARVGAYGPGVSEERFAAYEAVAALKAHFGGASAATKSRSASSLPAFSSAYLARGVGASDPSCAADDETECPASTLNGGELPTAEEPSDDDSNSGLSRDEKIALGVCLGVGGAIILAIVLFCVLRKPSSSSAKPSADVEMTTATYDV